MSVRLVGNFVPVNRRGLEATILFETFGLRSSPCGRKQGMATHEGMGSRLKAKRNARNLNQRLSRGRWGVR